MRPFAGALIGLCVWVGLVVARRGLAPRHVTLAERLAKADSLRATQTADELARSEKASERMGIPVVAMFFGFLALMLALLMAQLAVI